MPRTRVHSCAVLIVSPEEEQDQVTESLTVALEDKTWTNPPGCFRRVIPITEEDSELSANDDGRDRWGRRLSLDEIFH